MIMKTNTFDSMAGKNEKSRFFKRNRLNGKEPERRESNSAPQEAENRIDEPELSVEVERKTNNLWLHRKRTER